MIQSWFKMAWRHARNSRFYTLLNLFGLTLGLVVTLLIGIWIADELRFNSLHQNHDRIAQVMLNTASSGAVNTSELLPIPLAAVLKNKYGQDFPQMALVFPNYTHVVAVGERKVSRSGVWAEPLFPELFTLPMIKGRRDALQDRSAVLLSKGLAVALFGSADPMGQTVRIDNVVEVKVGGIYEDLPLSSSFYGTDLILPWDKAKDEMPWFKDAQSQWGAMGFRLYVELNPSHDIVRLSEQIRSVLSPYIKDSKAVLFLHPMNSWHLHSEFKDGRVAGGRIRLVWLFGGIGLFVLALACINFMNLATARSEKRAKEVGIRKTLGSLRRELVGQFLSEAILMTFAAGILALLLTWFLLPWFNRLSGKEMVFPYEFIGAVVAFLLLIGIIAGSYPAFYLSHFRPVKVLKGSWRAGLLVGLGRRVLVVLQFTVSIGLIIGTLLINRQIQYAKDRPVGYNREGLLTIGINTPELYQANYNRLRADLIATGAVADMCESQDRSTEEPQSTTGFDWEGKDPGFVPSIVSMDITHDYGHTVGWELIAGRDFSREQATDSGAVILNETAARLIGMTVSSGRPATPAKVGSGGGATRMNVVAELPAGKSIRISGKSHRVIGIVKDMVMASPWRHTPPQIFMLSYQDVNFITVRVNPALSMSAALLRIEKVFHQYNPSSSFDPQFIDQEYALKFSDEQRVSSLAVVFTGLAIFISCLGLLGLSAYQLEQRKKEIGIRKVLGAPVWGIAGLLARDFIRLVLLACLIAIPLSVLLLHEWLQQYEYRVGLSPWLFVIAAVGAIGLALLTVGYHSLKAARTNPIRSLRTQ